MIKAIYDRKHLIWELNVSENEHGIHMKACCPSIVESLQPDTQGGDPLDKLGCAEKI